MISVGGKRCMRIITTTPSITTISNIYRSFQSNIICNNNKIEHDDHNIISWYPGHIAKAEKELQDYIKVSYICVVVTNINIILLLYIFICLYIYI